MLQRRHQKCIQAANQELPLLPQGLQPDNAWTYVTCKYTTKSTLVRCRKDDTEYVQNRSNGTWVSFPTPSARRFALGTSRISTQTCTYSWCTLLCAWLAKALRSNCDAPWGRESTIWETASVIEYVCMYICIDMCVCLYIYIYIYVYIYIYIHKYAQCVIKITNLSNLS
jgi:hypothetical protein